MENNYQNIKDILWHKRSIAAEIELTLFENCDINCSFCGHSKESTLGMTFEEMFSKMATIEEFVKTVDSDIEFVNLHMLGGELFQDRLLSNSELNMLGHYFDLSIEFKRICEIYGKVPRVLFVTSNLSKYPEKILDFLIALNEKVVTRLIVSYDLSGRPITSQYRKNIEVFRDYISNINMVSTKPSIKKLISQKNEYFDYLYCNFVVYMDDFLPDKESEYLIPSDDDLLALMNYCYKNYPNVLPFAESVTAIEESNDRVVSISGSTFNKCTILPSGEKTNYVWKRHTEDNFIHSLDLMDNSNMLHTMLIGNNCLSCEYFDSCHLRCPVLWSWKNRERSEGCVNKKFYDGIKG